MGLRWSGAERGGVNPTVRFCERWSGTCCCIYKEDRVIGKIDSVMVRDPRALEVRVGKVLDTPRRPLQRLFLSAGETDK